MKLLFSLSVLITITSNSFCQEYLDRDSLWKALEKSEADTNRVKIYIQLGQQYDSNAPDSALDLYAKALALSKALNYPPGIIRYYTNATYVYNILGKYDTSLLLNLQSVEIAKKLGDKERIGSCLANVGASYLYLEDYSKSIDYSLQAQEIFEQLKDDRRLAIIYSNLGNVYRNLHQYNSALNYALKGLALARNSGNPYSISIALATVGSVQTQLGKMAEAIPLLQEAATLSRKSNDQFTLLAALLNLHDANMRLGQYSLLEPVCREALAIAEAIGDPDGMAISYRGLAYHYLFANDLIKAEEYGKTSLKKAIENKLTAETSKSYLVLSEIALLQKRNRQYQIYQYKSDSIQETIFAEDKAKNIQRLEVQFQTRQKELQLTRLQQEVEVKDLTLKQNRLLIGILILSIFAGGIISWLVVGAIRQRRILAENENEINHSRIQTLESEKQLLASEAVIKGQDDERSRLAKDLHDGLGGLLTGVKFSLANMKTNVVLDADNALLFERSLDMLDHSISELRRVAQNMMPEALIKYGLSEALRNYCDSLRQSKVFQIDFQTIGMETRVESNIEIYSFRIVQELLNNVTKHAKATHVLVQLAKQGNELSVTVEDNGLGMSPLKMDKSTGAGWGNIRARIEYLKGKLDVQSQLGQGTSVHFIVPLG